MHRLIDLITSNDPEIRNQSLDAACGSFSIDRLRSECAVLDQFRRQSTNLYERVRSLFFLYAIHRFHLPSKADSGRRGLIPFKGYELLLERRFEEAIDSFLAVQESAGPSDAICSALATSYHR